MARYYFHTQDGVVLNDEEGMELSDFGAVKQAAIDVMTHTLSDKPDLLWDTNSVSIVVTDDARLILMQLELQAIMAPAAPKVRAPDRS